MLKLEMLLPWKRRPGFPAPGTVSKIVKGFLCLEMTIGVLFTFLLGTLIYNVYAPVYVKKALTTAGKTKEEPLSLDATEFFYIIVFYVLHLYTLVTLWSGVMKRNPMGLTRWINIRGVTVALLTTVVLAHVLVYGHIHITWIIMLAYICVTMPGALEYREIILKMKFSTMPGVADHSERLMVMRLASMTKPSFQLDPEFRSAFLRSILERFETKMSDDYIPTPVPPPPKKTVAGLNV